MPLCVHPVGKAVARSLEVSHAIEFKTIISIIPISKVGHWQFLISDSLILQGIMNTSMW